LPVLFITEGSCKDLLSHLEIQKILEILDLFKRILKQQLDKPKGTARQTKERSNNQNPRTKVHKLWVPELDEMAKKI